ncbi:MAG: DoxX family protein [Halobacteriovoraceae bacterium]|nr:DoxX family protein [Halobacteriovoraceae bacterium]|tara:strand:- start:1539 stop:1922 length:384 start_codon:yes stop_codon:yes gene_type:complete
MNGLKMLNQDIGLLVFRVSIGLLMIFPHGFSKAVSFGDKMDVFPDPIGFGSPVALALTIFSEVICSLMIILGIKTRIFATPLFITMLVAAFHIHASDPWNVKEKAILFGVAYLTLIITGGGKYSVRD